MHSNSIPAILARTPEHYRNFLKELMKPPSPVHFVPEQGKWKKHHLRDERLRIENIPIRVMYPPQADEGLWGGEGIIKGFQKRQKTVRKVPFYWFPMLKNAVVYSEILDKHMKVTVTERTLQLIDQHYGFDNYILKSPVQDLKSQLALNLRREMLLALVRQELYPHDPMKGEKIYQKYKEFIIPENEAEWFGLSKKEAVKKQQKIEEQENKPVPLKLQYRKELIDKLKEMQSEGKLDKDVGSATMWLSRLNPFTRWTSSS